MTGRFPPDAIIRRVDAEGVLLLGGGRALLLQLAHPLVARGVAEHSEFESDPLPRLRATLEAAYTIVFGTDEEAQRTGAVVQAVHERVRGPGYAASDPALICWVNATLVDTGLRVYEHTIGRLTPAERERYYQESAEVAEVLGCPRSAQPETYDDFRQYVRTMVSTLEVSETARGLARSVFRPDLPWIAGPPLSLAKFVTVGMLPEPLRRQYGYRWSKQQDRLLRAGTRGLRTVLPLMPRPLRTAPMSALT